MPAKIPMIAGEKFGRWTVIEEAAPELSGKRRWLCTCECATVKTCRVSHLRSGQTTSCGCYKRDRLKTHGLSSTPEYSVWSTLKARCLESSDKKKHYFDRGIMVCERWVESFESFLHDMGKRPTEDHEIDRKNNDQGYTPENCRWVTRRQNTQNTRASKTWYYKGKVYNSKTEVCEHEGISRGALDNAVADKNKVDIFSELIYA